MPDCSGRLMVPLSATALAAAIGIRIKTFLSHVTAIAVGTDCSAPASRVAPAHQPANIAIRCIQDIAATMAACITVGGTWFMAAIAGARLFAPIDVAARQLRIVDPGCMVVEEAADQPAEVIAKRDDAATSVVNR